jgi:membrane-associated HD superfamily phosphohydrolase
MVKLKRKKKKGYSMTVLSVCGIIALGILAIVLVLDVLVTIALLLLLTILVQRVKEQVSPTALKLVSGLARANNVAGKFARKVNPIAESVVTVAAMINRGVERGSALTEGIFAAPFRLLEMISRLTRRRGSADK